MIGFLGHSHFLEHQCLLSAFKASSGSNGKQASQDCQCLPLVIDLTCLPILALSLTELPRIVNSLKFCAHGALGMLPCKYGGKEQW